MENKKTTNTITNNKALQNENETNNKKNNNAINETKQ